MNVLSLFDGISCGMVALERAGIKVDKYVAYEIDENAIKISKKNYPKIIHRGDVEDAEYKDGEYDLLIGGSPCQSLSSCGIQWKHGKYGIMGSGPSRLFWEYVRALKTINPKYFLFENVASMRNADKQIITERLGVQPIKIDSQILSAQKRNRLYWTNIPFETITERLVSTTLQDILEPDEAVDEMLHLCQGTLEYIMRPASKGWRSGKMEIDLPIARPILATSWKIHRADTDNYITSSITPAGRTNVRRLTALECERLQTLPDNYTNVEDIGYKERLIAIGNSWTVDVIAHIFKGLKEEL